MVLTALIILIPGLLGSLLAIQGRLFQEKVTTVLSGSILGLAFFTTVAYLLSPFFSLLLAAFLAIGVMAIAVALLIWQKPAALKQWWQETSFDPLALLILAAVALLSSLIAPKLLIAQADGLATGIINAYGDVAWHLANITSFTEGQTIPPENPIFAGTRLTYPFLTNFFSAILLASGGSLAGSVTHPAWILIPLLLTLLYCFTRQLTRSKIAAILALLLFLFGGATFGWVRFAGDWRSAQVSLVEFLTHLPARDFSGVGTDEEGFHFLNPVTTLLLPQRSFLFALPLALTILLLLSPGQKLNTARYVGAGMAAGLLPLFHAHTVVALLPALASFFILDFKQRKHWLLLAVPALVVGLPEVLYYLRGQEAAGSFLRWGPRWLAGERNFFWYWFLNTGLLIPASIAGLLMAAPRSSSSEVGQALRNTKTLAISGLIIFVVANLYLFAPWAWDNFKLFVYFFLFILPLVGTVAARAFQSHAYPVLKGTVATVLLLHMLAAGLDIWKLTLPTARQWPEWDAVGIEFAESVKEKTEPGERVLTAANHNSPIVLAGRPRYLGFAAHVWSHGGDPWEREAAVKDFYEGRLETLPDLQPMYAVVSPQERGSFPGLIIRPQWQLITQVGDYQLYQL